MTNIERGQWFHEQLKALIPDDPHDDDDAHDEAVGAALHRAVTGGEPEEAVTAYNAWAESAGYKPIRFLGHENGVLRADIVTAVITLDKDFALRIAGPAA